MKFLNVVIQNVLRVNQTSGACSKRTFGGEKNPTNHRSIKHSYHIVLGYFNNAYRTNFQLILYLFKCVKLNQIFKRSNWWLSDSTDHVPIRFLCQQQLCLRTVPDIKVVQARWLSWPHNWSTTSYSPSSLIFVQVLCNLSNKMGWHTTMSHPHLFSCCKQDICQAPILDSLSFSWYYAQFYWSCQNSH